MAFELKLVKYLLNNIISISHFGGELSPKNDLHNLSASLRVIIPHLLEETGIAPALLKISN